MARTKKYFSSNLKTSSRQGFYRPIKRKPVVKKKPKLSSTKSSTIEPETIPNQIQDLDDQMQITQQLKEELSKQIQQQIQESTQAAFDRLNQAMKRSQSAAPQPASHPPASQPSHSPTNPAKQQVSDHHAFGEHSEQEKVRLLQKELKASLKKAKKREKELDELKEVFEKEKSKMHKKIKGLRSDIKQHVPISENKFFTISKELKTVVESMNKLLEEENLNKSQLPPVANSAQSQSTETITSTTDQKPISESETETKNKDTSQNQPSLPESKQESSPTQESQSTTTTVVKQTTAEPVTEKKKFKIPKSITILGSTLVIVLLIGGVLWFTFFNSNPQVDTNLIQEYLPEGSSAPSENNQPEKKIEEQSEDSSDQDDQEASSQPKNTTTQAFKEHIGKVQGAQDDKYAQSQTDVEFTDTKWDTLKDSVLGYEITYPVNSVNVVKTDASVTFIRKTGYIFKIQLFKTDLDVEEYWKLVSGTSLKYKVNKTTFREKDALFLELEDFTDYPGDKYLVKHGDYIFDVWYATYSKSMNEDDLKRVDIMLNSFKFSE